MELKKNVNYVEQSTESDQWRMKKMNPQNEIARNLRCVIENIDKILETEHLDFKKAEKLIAKRNAYSEYLKSIIPNLQGVDY